MPWPDKGPPTKGTPTALASPPMRLSRLAALLLLLSAADASAIFVYDFPGSPPNGAASNQTNSQPANATFGDFTRTNVMQTGDPNFFNSSDWNTGSSIDLTKFVGFSITADVGYHLNLTSLTFDALKSLNGPNNGQVSIFINGSATAYETFLYTPATTLTNETFDFTDLTDTDNATTAEFRFYGWNSTGPGERLGFDNVTTNGTISNLPEPANSWAILLPVAIVIHQLCRRAHARKSSS
jgi:hypothetical protein